MEIDIHIDWVWPIVCSNFHKLEHDFLHRGEHQRARSRARFLHGGEHQRARSRARFLHGGGHQRARSRARFLHGGEHQRARARFFARKWIQKKNDPDHDFLPERKQFSRNPHQKNTS
jgi:hypothetical protein